MTDILTPTTQLEAINEMLSAISEAPVASVDIDHADVDIALRKLRYASRAVQSKGWHWNTDERYTLQPDAVTGYINLPINTLSVDTVGDSADRDLVERGRRLYDRENFTYVISEPVMVDLVTMLDYEDMPEIARRYVLIKATLAFQKDMETPDTDLRFSQAEVDEAMADLIRDQLKSADTNILYGTSSILETLDRVPR